MKKKSGASAPVKEIGQGRRQRARPGPRLVLSPTRAIKCRSIRRLSLSAESETMPASAGWDMAGRGRKAAILSRVPYKRGVPRVRLFPGEGLRFTGS